MLDQIISTIRDVTSESAYRGRMFLVGGIIRDRILGIETEPDIDIVCLDDALEIAGFVFDAGVTDHPPVVYPRFGTAMTSIRGVSVEFARARRDSYEDHTRKPVVEAATLEEDALRRDFTVNTLMENLHTGDTLDLTGRGMSDIADKVLRTPLEPSATFRDDPLRMLRAVRFAAKLRFRIDGETEAALRNCVDRLAIVSRERIRDEFAKTLLLPDASKGMELLADTGLMLQFAPELLEMRGVTQNKFHLYDVWEHTMKALEALPDDASLEVRLAMLFHDIGKPVTRTVDEQGEGHFYGHQGVGAEMTARLMRRLKFSTTTIDRVSSLVARHMRIGEYKPEFSEGAVRRLARDLGDDIDDLFVISSADKAACNPEFHYLDNRVVRERISSALAEVDYVHVDSPLDGREIMELTGLGPGPKIGELKEMLISKVLEGELGSEDKESAGKAVLGYLENRDER